MKSKNIEIMSPVGSYEMLMAAINAGAGSVYFGASHLNMRAKSSKNFTLDDLVNIANICKDNGVASYLTVNTIIYDSEIPEMQKIIDTAKQSGISAIIASDIAAIEYARTIGMEVHISTQLNITNTLAVQYFSKYADVIVLARELNLEQVKYICDYIEKKQIKGPSGDLVRIEMFIHGALCMAISGKCYLSLDLQNHSANRGDCLQICRRPYEVTDKTSGLQLEIDNEYIMSPKDLCTIDFLDKILDAGATVLKIEGRGRSPEYVKVTTEVYHQAVQAYLNGEYTADRIEEWKSRLSRVYNRGFWDGYYLGRKIGEWTNRKGSSATTTKEYVGKVVNYYAKIGVVDVLVEDQNIQVGDEYYIIGSTTGVVEGKIESMKVDDIDSIITDRGSRLTFKVPTKVRENDRLYKIVKRQDLD